MNEAVPGAVRLDSKGEGGRGPFGALLLSGDPQLPGIVLFHGRNSNPDGPVVGKLRRSLAAAGYTTLSLENPIPPTGDEFADYLTDVGGSNTVFPEASARTATALRELQRLNLRSGVLLGFSMGSRLLSAFLASDENERLPIVGFIGLGLGVNGAGPLNATTTLRNVRVPVLDVCGDADADVAKSAPARKASYEAGPGKSYRHVVLTGGIPHNFAGADAELERTVLDWLRKLPLTAYSRP